MQVVAASRDNAGAHITHSYLCLMVAATGRLSSLVVPTTGYTDGYAYSTLRVMRDRNSEPGGSNVSNDDCKSSGVTMTVSRQSNSDCKSSE